MSGEKSSAPHGPVSRPFRAGQSTNPKEGSAMWFIARTLA